jgi:hypothetical protein
MSTEPPKQPSDFYRAFTWDRLTALADRIFACRLWVAENARPDKGDSLCQIGLRAFDHTKHTITTAAANEFRDWLSVEDGGQRFVFKLDMMPIRFLRSDSEKPLPPNYAVPSARELAVGELALKASGGSMGMDKIFRVLIEGTRDGYPTAVFLVVADLNGRTILQWRIPRGDEGMGSTPIVVPQTPIDLGPLMVETVEEVEQREAAERAEQERQEAEQKKSPKKGA